MNIEFTYKPDFSPENGGKFLLDPFEARRRMRLVARAGFSRVITGDCDDAESNITHAAYMLRHSHSLGVELTLRAGSLDPVVAAGRIASLDDGRLSLRVLRPNLTQEGGQIDHEGGQRSMDEYLVLLKRLWTNAAPFDYEGPYHRVRQGFVTDKGAQACDIPIRMDGLTGTALRVAARHATVFELAGGARLDLVRTIERVNAAAMEFGRAGKIRFSQRVDVGLGRNWRISPTAPGSVALSCDAQQVAAALLSYAQLGVTDFVVGGLQTAAEIETFGRDVVQPLAAANVSSSGSAPRFARSISV